MFRPNTCKFSEYYDPIEHKLHHLLTITRMLQKQGVGGPDHDQQGAVSIGGAWDSLELKLNVMEVSNKSYNTSISSIYLSIPATEEKRMEGEGK